MSIATRAAAARPEDTWFQVRALAREVWGPAANWPTPFAQLCDLNTPESLLAAAMMLLPEFDGGSHIDLFLRPGGTVARVYTDDDTDFKGLGKTPALALIAAIAASRGV